MTSTHPIRLAALLAVAVFASACSDSPTGPIAGEAPELSQVLAELQPASLAPLASQISAAPLAGLDAPNPSACTYDSTTKSFVCPNVAITGVTVSRRFTLLDASGNPMTQYDRTATAAVRMASSFAGTITSGASIVTVDQTQDVTLSGLATGVRTLGTPAGASERPWIIWAAAVRSGPRRRRRGLLEWWRLHPCRPRSSTRGRCLR